MNRPLQRSCCVFPEIVRHMQQVLSGTGQNEDFLGPLNDPDVIDADPPGDDESLVHALRRAIRLVAVQGRTRPNGILLNPTDMETLDLHERNEEENNFLSMPFAQLGQPRLFGIPLIETDAVPPTVGLVGDFTKAVLFDRESVTVAVGTIMDDFVRNIVRILAELRCGFATIRPKAFARVSLVQRS